MNPLDDMDWEARFFECFKALLAMERRAEEAERKPHHEVKEIVLAEARANAIRIYEVRSGRFKKVETKQTKRQKRDQAIKSILEDLGK